MKKTFPNLFIPGAGKSGTSTLHELLNFHPDINMSSKKEPHFWTDIDFDNYTLEDYNKYKSLFSNEDSFYKGESSTGYMLFPNFTERIKANYESEPKFIFILRNPIDRCYSHYWWLKGIGSEKKSFKTAVQFDFNLEPNHSTKLPEANYKSYFQFGLYGKWLKQFYDNFDHSNIKIITSENLRINKLDTINSCFDFLGLKPLSSIPEVNSNKTLILKHPYLYRLAKLVTFNKTKLPQFVKDLIPSKLKKYIRAHLMTSVLKMTKTSKSYPSISNEDRLWLKEQYRSDVAQLKQITGESFNEWTDFND